MNSEQRARVKEWLIERGKEPTTWRGVALLIAACGIAISPDHAELMTAMGMFASGLIGVATKDPK